MILLNQPKANEVKPLPYTASDRIDLPQSFHLERYHRASDCFALCKGDVCFADGFTSARAVEFAKAMNENAANVLRLTDALERLLLDVKDYPAWQRPCDAVDKAEALLAQIKEGK